MLRKLLNNFNVETWNYLLNVILYSIGLFIVSTLFFFATPKDGNNMYYLIWIIVWLLNLQGLIISFNRLKDYLDKKVDV